MEFLNLSCNKKYPGMTAAKEIRKTLQGDSGQSYGQQTGDFMAANLVPQ